MFKKFGNGGYFCIWSALSIYPILVALMTTLVSWRTSVPYFYLWVPFWFVVTVPLGYCLSLRENDKGVGLKTYFGVFLGKIENKSLFIGFSLGYILWMGMVYYFLITGVGEFKGVEIGKVILHSVI